MFIKIISEEGTYLIETILNIPRIITIETELRMGTTKEKLTVFYAQDVYVELLLGKDEAKAFKEIVLNYKQDAKIEMTNFHEN